MISIKRLVLATRPSTLARWQTGHVASLLEDSWPGLSCAQTVIETKGDRDIDTPLPEIGGKGLFTFELENALRSKQVDAVVHSLKDLPTENPAGLTIGAILPRARPEDVLLSLKGETIDLLARAAVVGTSSLRREAQILALRPDLKMRPVRGNVDTRIRKLREGHYDAIILAAAGVIRLGLEEHIAQYLPPEIMLPAPGQGALAVQCREGDKQVLQALAVLEDPDTRRAISAERTFLNALGGGCSLPVGALAHACEDKIHMQAVVASPDGRKLIRLAGVDVDPAALGNLLAQQALSQGAQAVLHG